MSELQVGDVVRLKSGGPDMTVKNIGVSQGEELVWCMWFAGPGDVKTKAFPPQALEKALKEDSDPGDEVPATDRPRYGR